jgi:VWFA-related protein
MATVSVSQRFLILTLGFILLTSVYLFAQHRASPSVPTPQSNLEEQSEPQYTFKTNVDRVIVDVIVNDANGKPVRGLNKQGFSIYEDGKSQKVLSFDVHSLDSDSGYFAKLPPMPLNTFVNISSEPERGPLYVLLLDLVNTEPDDQMHARQELLKFVDAKPQGTRFAVFVVSDGLYLAQGFTADRTRLYATLDPSHSIPHVPRVFLLGCNYGKDDSTASVSVFKSIAEYLMGLPGRKNIIWVSGLFPLNLFPHDDEQMENREDVREALDAITKSDSAIYPVSVSGVQVLSPGVSLGGSAAGSSDCPVSSSVASNHLVQDEVAEITGGRAFYSRNDLKDVLQTATEAGSEYYTMTYSPSNRNFDGKTRTIRVELEKKNYHLEYRRAYATIPPPSPTVRAKSKPRDQDKNVNLRPIGDSLAAYMQRGAPIARQVYFRAHVQALDSPHIATADQMDNMVNQPTYFHLRHKKHPSKPLKPVVLQSYLIEYQIIARIPNLEVAAGVYDDDGSLLNGDVEEASSTNPTAPDPQAKFAYFRVQQKIDVPANAVSLRVGVRDLSTDRMGTMEISLPLAPEPVLPIDSRTAAPSAKQ